MGDVPKAVKKQHSNDNDQEPAPKTVASEQPNAVTAAATAPDKQADNKGTTTLNEAAAAPGATAGSQQTPTKPTHASSTAAAAACGSDKAPTNQAKAAAAAVAGSGKAATGVATTKKPASSAAGAAAADDAPRKAAGAAAADRAPAAAAKAVASNKTVAAGAAASAKKPANAAAATATAAAPKAEAGTTADKAPAATTSNGPAAGTAAGKTNPAADVKHPITSSSAAAAATADAAAVEVALCDLKDPRCIPGTPEFEVAAKKVRETLEVYKARVKQYIQAQRSKPDMIAYKDLRREHTPAKSYGHIPGIRVGQEFLGRGELAILGLHTQMMRGILAEKGKPAYAIAMSGGYKDDADTGHTFWYTGQGGQKKGIQTEDQSYEAPDNAALVECYKQNAPVRVFRGKMGANQERLYVYEGLYKVAAHKMEKSQDGPLVCKFQMVGVPGHSVVSSTVEYKCLTKTIFQTVLLARGPAAKPGRKRRRAAELRLLSRSDVESSIQQRKAAGSYGRLVTADISDGQEKLPIPVWNNVDAEDSILLQLGHNPSEGAAADGDGMEEDAPLFEYTSDYKFGEDEAKELAIKAEKEFSTKFSGTCGLQFASKERDSEGLYNEQGLMMSTQPCGLMECDEGCARCKHCKLNRVVSGGIRYPLEVFKVSKAVGWGVRCSQDLPTGAFICCYIGLVITDEWAEKLRHQDLYLFDLNHFHLLWEADDANNMPDVTMNENLHKLEGELRAKHLVIDANRQGNVGRFINHSCDPNCVVQTVFAGNARSQLLYYMAIVAMKDIPAYTELTYDYGYSNKSTDDGGEAGNNVRITCQCGAASCRHNLL